MLPLLHLLRNLYFLSFLSAGVIAQYSAVQRWGQASALVNNILFVYGGKTDQYNQYSYTSAPNNNDLLRLSLSISFDLATPPWQYLAGSSNLSTTQGPAIAWSTLSAYNTSQLLLFGGEPGPNSATVISTLPDSADILDIYGYPQWISKPNSWANEPTRRIYHSASSTGGKIWITGGEKADGSNNAISDHELFDPSIPTFSQLPPANGPPDIYGHTSIVLSNGSLIVFGGYSQSLASMIPFSMIWMLDTTVNNLQWTTLSVASANLPNPRRGFAAALLGNGKVLIHGGADATLGTTYSDGWMLDTAQDPMIWSVVPQLSQLGPRRDHLAAANGNTVFFAFGYGSNGPASTGLFLYDSSSGTWPTSFTPSAATPVNTLPPSPEANPLTGSTGNTYFSSGSQTGTVYPTSTGGNNGTGNTSNRTLNQRIIALISVFAVISLVAGSVLAIYFIRRRRRRRRNAARFHMLGISEDDESPHAGGPIPVAGIVAQRTPFFGLVGRTVSPQRRDILADEDTRYFGVPRREGSGATSYNSFVRSEKPGFTVHGSLVSLRSVGAMLGINAVVRGDKTRQSSKSSRASSWDEKGLDPFSDEAALVPGLLNTSRLKGGRTSSWALPTYVDPFSDKEIGEYHDGDSDAHSINMEAMLNERSQRGLEIPVPIPEHGSLSPILETVIHRSGPHSSESADHQPPSGNSTIGSSSEEILQSLGVRRSSILDANPPPNQPIRRSDSWWSKFTKTPFLDRRSSDGVRPQHLVEFRDPNPPPRLGAIEERSPDSLPPSRNASVNRYHHQMYSIVTHGRSVSSMQTTQTADSETLERVGGMDIVQRDSTIGSRQSSGIDDPVAQISGPLSVVMSADSSDGSHERSSVSGGSGVSLAPMDVDLSASVPARPSTPSSSPKTTIPESGARSSHPTRLPTGGMVSSRVQAFERRMSLDSESSRLPSPDERSTKNREVRMGKDRDRRTVKYGFAPKPSLFVANPDRKSWSNTS